MDSERGPGMSAAPDWAAIFKRHPELTPPGYLEACLDMAERPARKAKRAKGSSSRKPVIESRKATAARRANRCVAM